VTASPAATCGRCSAIQRGGQRRVYDVSRDGQRILVNTADEQTSSPFTLVINWAEGLTK
jgi:hypothetical protein